MEQNSYARISNDVAVLANNGLRFDATAPPPPMPNAHCGFIEVQHTTMTPVMPVYSIGPSYMPVNSNPPVGPKSVELTCPSCRCRIKTKVNHRSTAKTHIACLLLSLTCFLCCLPYCMDSCRNANHFCPQCGVFIGTYQS